MARSQKNCVDLKEIINEWKNLEKVKGEANLRNLKLSVTNVQWTNVTCLSDPGKTQTAKVSAEYTSEQKDRLAKVSANYPNQIGTHVTIQKGYVKDLHKTFTLPLAGLPKAITDVLGSSVEIDVGTAETNEQKMELFVSSSHKIDQTDGKAPTAAEATITSSTGTYVGQFSGKAELRGEVILNDNKSVEQCPFSEMVTCIKSKSKNVETLCVSDDGLTVHWTITGECLFHLGTKAAVQWSERR
ncbi:unnamed protein product [Lymnaea stagnalis]|uniref:Uncharacterized protein n=1 Tax=Lymnaea stagnalis TaxID=6523 RepID=A0AAV2HNY9_LYMST